MLVKKALIITYYWPPSGGGGVQRWLKFVKYLGAFGWEPTIYTPENPDFEIKDSSLEADIPEGTKVIRRPIWEPFGLYRRLLGKKAVQQQGVVSESKSVMSRLAIWVRGNYFIPDSRIFWVRPSANYLTKYLKNNPIDVIITTGPPHSVHLIGLELKKRTALPWLADFRDPWSQWDVLDQLKLSRNSRQAHLRLENSVLSNADLVVTVSPSLEESLKELGAKNIQMITNGFDSEVISKETSGYQKFRISHLGLLNRGRNPEVLWQVLNELCSEDEDFANVLEIFLAGTVEKEVLNSLEGYDELKTRYVPAGYRSHDEIIGDNKASALFLLLINNTSNAQWILPGKMFEYIGQGKPILALGDPESDASDVLLDAGYNRCLRYDDYSTIKAQVLEAYKIFCSGGEISKKINMEKYHRKDLTSTLATCLDKLI